MGKHMRKALAFAAKYDGWHSFAQDKTTKNAIQSLVKRGMVEVNEYNQFKATQYGRIYSEFKNLSFM